MLSPVLVQTVRTSVWFARFILFAAGQAESCESKTYVAGLSDCAVAFRHVSVAACTWSFQRSKADVDQAVIMNGVWHFYFRGYVAAAVQLAFCSLRLLVLVVLVP